MSSELEVFNNLLVTVVFDEEEDEEDVVDDDESDEDELNDELIVMSALANLDEGVRLVEAERPMSILMFESCWL